MGSVALAVSTGQSAGEDAAECSAEAIWCSVNESAIPGKGL